MARTVLGVFSDRIEAEHAIEELEGRGYLAKDISLVMRDRTEAADIASDTGANVVGGAVSGATTGGVIGGLTGLLVGVGALAVPGIGALLIGGPLAAALGLTGAAATTVSGAVTGALAGGLVGALMGLGLPEEEARVYEERIRDGGILLAVPTQNGREKEIFDIMEEHGADQIRMIDDSQPRMTTRIDEPAVDYAPAYYQEVRVDSGDDLTDGTLTESPTKRSTKRRAQRR